jgi:three-Cys-motif partner protein
MPFPSRDSQTRIKHAILVDYLGAWAGIIQNGLRRVVEQARRRRRPFRLNLVYLDAFAGFGMYERDSDRPSGGEPVWGSPILAMRALEQASTILGDAVSLTGVLIEKEADRVRELQENVEAARLRTPMAPPDDAGVVAKGCLTIIHGDFRQYSASVLEALDEEDFLFAFVDPYGMSMSMEGLASLLGRPRTDALVLFPVADLNKKAGSLRKAPDERTPTEEVNLRLVREHLGTAEWQRIAVDGALDRQSREAAYASLYHSQLRDIDPGLAAKSIEMTYSAIDRAVYHLFLTTRDYDGALKMNEVLRKAAYRQHWTLWGDREQRIRERSEAAGELSLFPDMPATQEPDPELVTPSMEEVQAAIRDQLGSGTYGYKDGVLKAMVEHPYTDSEIRRALTALKRTGAAEYETPVRKNSAITVRFD